jgi:hypothetical protein
MAFQMNGKQRFLHNVLRLDTALHDLAPAKAPNQGGSPTQEIRIGSFVSRDRGSHEPCKLGLILAVHKICLSAFVFAWVFVTRAAKSCPSQ